MENLWGDPTPTDPVGVSFDLDWKFQQRYSLALSRWPKVTNEEYIMLLPTIWVEDRFNQYELCHMKYEDFLRTQYWKAISWKAKQDHKYCQDCFEYLQQLHVHHLTYVRRGLEWLHPEDLVVLCHSCHKARHGK